VLSLEAGGYNLHHSATELPGGVRIVRGASCLPEPAVTAAAASTAAAESQPTAAAASTAAAESQPTAAEPAAALAAVPAGASVSVWESLNDPRGECWAACYPGFPRLGVSISNDIL
jgi:hypothetical protein